MGEQRSRFLGAVMPPIPLQPLLFRQTVLLALIIGVAAYWWTAAWGLLLIIFLLDSRSHDWLRLILILFVAAAGFCYASWRDVPPPPEFPSWTEEKNRVPVSGVVYDVRGLPGNRLRIVLDDVKRNDECLPGKLAWTWEMPLWRPVVGESVAVQLRIRPSVGFRNAGRDQDSWARQGIFWRAYSSAGKGEPVTVKKGTASSLFREKYRSMLVDRLQQIWPAPAPEKPVYGKSVPAPPGGWGMLPALLFGDRSFLGVDEVEHLTSAGLVHSIALSGQHLAVAGVLALVLLFCVGAVIPRLWEKVPRYCLVLPLTIVFAAGYLWLGSAPPSLWRAFIMLASWSVFTLMKRPAAFPDSMLFALACMSLACPVWLTDIGVQLSFASVAGISLLSPLLARVWNESCSGMNLGSLKSRICFSCCAFMLSIMICSLAVQVSTLPLTLFIFGRTTIWFPLNLIWLPVLGFWVLPIAFLGLGALVLGFDGGASICFIAAATPCHWLLEGIKALDQAGLLNSVWITRPHWAVGIGWGLLVLIAAVARARPVPLPAKWCWLAIAGFVLCLSGPLGWFAHGLSNTVTLRVLDVGQGQAVLLELPGNRRMLVDSGGFTSDRFDTGRDVVGPVLADNAPLKLDILAFTHPDIDHVGGMHFIIRHFDIGQAFVPDKLFSKKGELLQKKLVSMLEERNVAVRQVRGGENIDIGDGIELQILAPLESTRKNPNDGMVLRLTRYGKGLAVIPGDAGRSLLNRLAASDIELSADILVAPHHGSGKSISSAFYKRVAPEKVLISCGLGNSFGFPARKVRDFLKDADIPWKSTAQSGELRVVWDSAGKIKVTEGAFSHFF